jgi:uncharacterized protein (TIGR00290 family)
LSCLKTACSWSSGKDSCLALYKALSQGLDVSCLFNFISQEYKRVSFHGAKSQLVKVQSDSIGIPLVQNETNENNYEEVFRKTLRDLKAAGITGIVRGDIHLLDLRDWVEDICRDEGLEVISPLWGKPAVSPLKEFVSCGFSSIVTSVQAGKLGKEWLGRQIDEGFISEIQETEGVDPCGENGEYHSFAFDGPIFRRRIEIIKTREVLIKGFWFLDILEYKTIQKGV